MAENSSIEWTDHTFNPWMGCTKVSDGCKHCYAETMMDKRWGKVTWGPQGVRVRTSDANWKKPLKWNAEARDAGVRRKVFCASLADVFESKPDQQAEMDEWRSALWELIETTPHLDWLLLTKRPQNVPYMLPGMWGVDGLPRNLWLGTSVENQEQADKRIPALLQIQAAVRFLSVEPLLGPVDLWGARYRFDGATSAFAWGRGVNWVICGGESGPHARPMHPQWARSIRDECQAADVPFFFKQWGEWGATGVDMQTGLLMFRQFQNEAHWIAKAATWIGKYDICVDMRGKVLKNGGDFATAVYPVAVMRRMGKKTAGRLLDGYTWDEAPVTAWRRYDDQLHSGR